MAMHLPKPDVSKALSLQIKDNVKPYQVPLRCVAYTLQEPFKKSYKDYRDKKY